MAEEMGGGVGDYLLGGFGGLVGGCNSFIISLAR